ncbi:MAG: hypothetical protein KF901_23910 [Myxococcales bacterium]|nr:hypothetical protein [Myxococcales bacterium]
MNSERPNPFERYGLDPMAGPAAITERLRELAEDAPDAQVAAEIREAWEALTLHPRRRVELALEAHPETRAPAPSPPRPARRPRAAATLTLDDLVALPSIASALGPGPDPLPDIPLDEDPVLGGS